MNFEDIKTVTIQSILDEKDNADKAVSVLQDEWEEAKTAFLQDCDRVDAALTGERESLQSEVDELNQTIKRLSGQLAAGVTGTGKIDKDVKENLRKLIREATAKREEAQATLDGLKGIEPEYNRELYDAAIAAKEKFVAAITGEYYEKLGFIRRLLDGMSREVEQAQETVVSSFPLYFVDEETERLENRMKVNRKDPKPVPAVQNVRILGEPPRRPVYQDEKEPEPAKTRTETFVSNGKKITRTINNKTDKVIRTDES